MNPELATFKNPREIACFTPTEFRIFRPDGSLLVSVNLDTGAATFGEGVEPDEAARRFWAAVAAVGPYLRSAVA